MNEHLKVLKEIKHQEEILKLYDTKVFNVPLWRLVRFQVRSEKLKKETGFFNRTTKVKLNVFSLLQNYIKSFFQLINLVFKAKKYKNIVFAFPRLVKHNGEYFDKFTDPIIEQTALKNQVLVVQRNLSGQQLKPRRSECSDIIMSDFVDYSSKLLAIVLSPLFYLIYCGEINTVYEKASKYFSLNNKFKLTTCFKIGEFYIQMNFWNRLFSNVACNNILLVDREVFFPHIVACKKKGIKTYELQHGVTHSETVLYTGSYQPKVDPDYFLTFGEKWQGTQFSMPIDRLINIGWAYRGWIQNKIENTVEKNTVLVVSSPAITKNIIQTTTGLAEMHKSYKFVLRLHPQEELSEEQLERLKKYKNIVIDSKEKDSLIAVLTSEFCVGENSTVLYEAIDYGKKVGKIMYNGLHSKRESDKEIGGVFYLNNVDDFVHFVDKKQDDDYVPTGIYDKFEPLKFERLIKW